MGGGGAIWNHLLQTKNMSDLFFERIPQFRWILSHSVGFYTFFSENEYHRSPGTNSELILPGSWLSVIFFIILMYYKFTQLVYWLLVERFNQIKSLFTESDIHKDKRRTERQTNRQTQGHKFRSLKDRQEGRQSREK